MAVSEVGICNLALARLGESRIISLSESTKAARACGAVYEFMRDEVLQAHPWTFAKTRATLARLDTIAPFGYRYAYQLPAGFLQAVRLHDAGADYEIEGNRLLTDESGVNLVYIERIIDTNRFSPLFVSALSARLAAEITLRLVPSAGVQKNMLTLYNKLMEEAKAADARQDQRAHAGLNPDNDSWITART